MKVKGKSVGDWVLEWWNIGVGDRLRVGWSESMLSE